MLAMGIRKNLANKIWLAFLLLMGIFVNGRCEKQLRAREPEKMSFKNKVLIDDFSSADEISVKGREGRLGLFSTRNGIEGERYIPEPQ